jgi:ComF family protein
LVRSAFRYDEPVRSLLVRVKYSREPDLLAALIHVARNEMPSAEDLRNPDAVIPVPTSSRRLRQRGFDPALVVARAVGDHLHLPVLKGTLRRVVQGPAQTTLSRSDRLLNLVGAFAAEGVLCRSVLLVDDVITTGGTLIACATALLDAGARRVTAFTLARTPAGR